MIFGLSIYKILGIIGLLSVSFGVIKNDGYYENFYYILGGVFLGIYSFFISEYIFLVLQIVFIMSAIYSIYKKKNVKR